MRRDAEGIVEKAKIGFARPPAVECGVGGANHYAVK
jgi:hypothetical protein